MKKRKTHIDLLRVIAIFLVVYIHTGQEAAQRYLVSDGFTYWFSLFMNALTQTCALLFFMISGALLLDKQEDLKAVYRKRVLRFAILLLVFGFAEYAYFFYLNPEIGFSIPVFLKMAYSSTIIHQYWFLYAYLAFLMVLPFIRMLAQNMKPVHFGYLAGLFFLFEGICPIAEYILGMGRIALSIPFFANIILYPLLGYFIEKKAGDFFLKRRVLLISNALAICAILTNMVIGHMAIVSRGDVEALEGMTMLISAVIYMDIRACFAKKECKQWFAKAVSFLGSGSICVFLLEPPLRDTFKVVYVKTVEYITWFPATILWVLCACIAGALIYHGLRFIPGVKRVL